MRTLLGLGEGEDWRQLTGFTGFGRRRINVDRADVAGLPLSALSTGCTIGAYYYLQPLGDTLALTMGLEFTPLVTVGTALLANVKIVILFVLSALILGEMGAWRAREWIGCALSLGGTALYSRLKWLKQQQK